MLNLNNSINLGRLLLPKEPSTQQFLKRILVVIAAFTALGFLMRNDSIEHLLLKATIFMLCALMLGFVDLLLIQKVTREGQEVGGVFVLSAILLAVIGLFSAVLPMIVHGEFMLSLGSLLFALPHIIFQLFEEWNKKPKVTIPHAEVLPWRSAFIEGLLAKTRCYLVFHIHCDSQKYEVGWSVDPHILLTPSKEMTLQKLFSNWVIRENNEVRASDLIPLRVCNEAGGKNIQWVFSRRKWLFFKSFVSPFSRISKLPLLWWPKIKLKNGQLKLIYSIEFTVEPIDSSQD